MKTLRRYFEIYGLMIRNSLIREMNFKANFLLWMVVEFLWFLGQIVYIEVLFQYVDRIGDWSKWQVLALFGTHQVAAQIFQAFFYVNLADLPELIRTGKLDLMLLLPVDAQFAVSTRKFGLDNMVNAFVGVAIVCFSLGKLQVLPGAAQIGLYAVAVMLGVGINYTILFTLSLAAFWIVRAQGIIYGYFNIANIGRYPDVVFKGVFKILFSVVIPMILVANVPVRLLLGTFQHPLQSLAWMALATFTVLASSRALWLFALKRYSSASS